VAISFKHLFQSSKGDPADTTLVRPSNWNAEHVLTMAADVVIGRGAMTGVAQEIPCTALARSLLAATTVDEFLIALGAGGFTTGDVKLTLKTTPDSTWVMANDGSIGDAVSSATTLASSATQALFTLIYNNVSNTYAPVSGGRGASAAADFGAHKRLTITKMLGRTLAVAGANGGPAGAWALGQSYGEEAHALTIPELAVFTPGGTVAAATVGGQVAFAPHNGSPDTGFAGGSGGNVYQGTVMGAIDAPAFTGTAIGGGVAHNNMQPTSFLNAMIKL
jgi:hypothetical protein